MPREFSRSQRMAEQIRRDLAEIIRDEVKDPRAGLISITAVKLSKDLGHAVIYCTVFREQEDGVTLGTLNKAAGFIRSELSRRVKARTVPTLKFVIDDSVERGAAMEDLIRRAIRDDADNGNEDEDE